MEKMQSTGSSMHECEKRMGIRTKSSPRIVAIRWFVAVFALAIVIDTLPNSWTTLRPLKSRVNTLLAYLGLSQGDWPLFAPNPVLNNGMIVAEVVDGNQQKATWNSIDWTRASVWQKFARFRHMNYFQRVGQNQLASSDLVDYLQQAIPDKEHATPMIRWNESYEILPPAELVPPIVDVKLYKYRHRMILSQDEPFPTQSETVWSNQGEFLLQREYSP